MLERLLFILIIVWALGFFALDAGSFIHILLILAALVLLARLMQRRKVR